MFAAGDGRGHAATVVPGVPVILQLATVRRQAGPEDPAITRGCCYFPHYVGWMVGCEKYISFLKLVGMDRVN